MKLIEYLNSVVLLSCGIDTKQFINGVLKCEDVSFNYETIHHYASIHIIRDSESTEIIGLREEEWVILLQPKNTNEFYSTDELNLHVVEIAKKLITLIN